ncbi:HAD family phosphatase [Streptomyces sp. NPDC047017]|uniref:HAD family hydrolase n=1 Tax=Streptomyces sp. NPDC047017 TaxID=3155024 RepID=UPI0033D9FE0B
MNRPAMPAPGWTPDAVVFDCDGTLVDSEQHWQRARAVVLRAFGHAPSPEFAERAKGLHYRDCGALMADLVGEPAHAEEMTQQLLNTFRALVAREPVATRGARQLVRALDRVAPLAVASNCPADVVEFCLESVDLRHHFRHIVVPEGDVLPKPHPDTYAKAARLLGASGGDVLAVEDSVNGMKAAVAAGLRVIGVGPDPEPEALALADLWVGALDDPRLAAWTESLPAARRPDSGPADTGRGNAGHGDAGHSDARSPDTARPGGAPDGPRIPGPGGASGQGVTPSAP